MIRQQPGLGGRVHVAWPRGQGAGGRGHGAGGWGSSLSGPGSTVKDFRVDGTVKDFSLDGHSSESHQVRETLQSHSALCARADLPGGLGRRVKCQAEGLWAKRCMAGEGIRKCCVCMLVRHLGYNAQTSGTFTRPGFSHQFKIWTILAVWLHDPIQENFTTGLWVLVGI